MIDDATSPLFGRFVRHDSTEDNMRLFREYLERFGCLLAFCTDQAGLFQTAVKSKRGEQHEGLGRPEILPSQIGRASQFGTAQDCLVKGMQLAGVCTIEAANAYLEEEYLPSWNQTLAVTPANPADAHRPAGKEHHLAAILSHVEDRQATNDYTVRYGRKLYQIGRKDIRTGLRGARVRLEKRLDGSLTMRLQGRHLTATLCAPAAKVADQKTSAPAPRKPAPKRRGRDWNRNFDHPLCLDTDLRRNAPSCLSWAPHADCLTADGCDE